MLGRVSVLRLVTIAALVACFVNAPVAANVVGQVISDQADIDGVLMPSGSTLLSESLVTTRDQPAKVRLSSGRVLGMAANSSARFEQTGAGGVSVAVVSGTVGFQEADGDVILLAQGNAAVLDQIEEGPATGSGAPGSGEPLGHIWEGEPHDEDEEIALCHLKDRQQTPENIVLCATDPDDLDPDERDDWRRTCDWERIKVKWKYVPEHLGHADVFADKDMRTEEMPDEIGCGKKAAYWALASLLLIPLAEDDDNPPPPALSPFIP